MLDGSGNSLTSTNGALNVSIQNSVIISGTVPVSQSGAWSVAVNNFPATQPISGSVSVSNFPATQPVSGSVSISNFPATQPVSGSVSISNFPATQPVSSTQLPSALDGSGYLKTHEQGTANVSIQNASIPVTQSGTWNIGSITTLPSLTIGTWSAGAIGVTQGTTPWQISLNSTVNSATNPIFERISDGTNPMGSMTTYGTAPSGYSLPVNAYITNTIADNLVNIGGSAVATSSAGVLKVGIVGSTASSLDSTVVPGTAPTNGVAILGQYNTTAPAPTAAQTVCHQMSPNGNLLVQTFRRSQVKIATGSIASTTAATLLAAQAGLYSDLKSLVLTLGGETTAAYIQVIISDGTNSYRFGFCSEAAGTAGAGSQPVCINWDVPLPASTVATAWTIALSVADATVYYVAQFVNQSANF